MISNSPEVLSAVYVHEDADDLSDAQRYFAAVDEHRATAPQSPVPFVLDDKQVVSTDMLYDRTLSGINAEPISRRLAEVFTDVCNSFARYHRSGQQSLRGFIVACRGFVRAENEIEVFAAGFSKSSLQTTQKKVAHKELRERLSRVVGVPSASMLSRYRKIGSKADLLLRDDIFPCLPVSIETLYTLVIGPNKDKALQKSGVLYEHLAHLRDVVKVLTPALTRSELESVWFNSPKSDLSSPAKAAGFGFRLVFYFQSESDIAECLLAAEGAVTNFLIQCPKELTDAVSRANSKAGSVITKRDFAQLSASNNS